MVYDRIVSLGSACEPAYQIRSHTGKSEADYFDWLITPAESLITAIETDFSGFDNKQDFVITEDKGSVINNRTKIEYRHSFPRGSDGLIRDDFLTSFSEYEARTAYLLGRWRSNFSRPGRVLFIRRDITLEEVDRLSRAIQDAYPQVQAKILVVASDDYESLTTVPGVSFAHIPGHTGDGLGQPEAWRRKFIQLGLVAPSAPTLDFKGEIPPDH